MATSSKLTVSLPSDREIQMTREFDAPRDLVFEAFTSCQHMTHWWGQAGSTLVTCEMEFRPGGHWRYVERDKEGAEWGFRGEYRAVARPERITWTFEFEGMPGHVSEETMVFEEHAGRTRIVTTSVFQSTEDRDGMIATGMEQGAGEAYDRLEEYIRTLAATRP